MDADLNANSPGVSRRSLLRRGLTALGVASIAPVLSACEVPFLSSGGDPFEMPVETPEEAIQRLLEGNARFVRGKSTTINESAERRAKIVQRQRPFATVFSCVDSRVPPELVFDRGLGDLFVIRTAGNVVDSAVMGSLEYGAYELEIPLLLVLGHKSCGAVKATMEAVKTGGKAEGSIGYLVDAIRPAIAVPPTEVLGIVFEAESPAAPTEAASTLVAPTNGEPALPTDLALVSPAATIAPIDAATPKEMSTPTAGGGTHSEDDGSHSAEDGPKPADEAVTEEAVTEEAVTEEAVTEGAVSEGGVSEEGVSEEGVTEEGVTEEGEEGGVADPLTDAIKRNVALTVKRIMKSPLIAERVAKDRLRVVGGFYDLETGIVELTENVPKEFLPTEGEGEGEA